VAAQIIGSAGSRATLGFEIRVSDDECRGGRVSKNSGSYFQLNDLRLRRSVTTEFDDLPHNVSVENV
jgi:hypothetical protein